MLKKIILAFTDKISMEEKMNKFKKVLLVIFAAVAVFAIALVAGCGNSKKLQTLNVDTSNAKTEYFVGQEFTAEGIVVTASLGKSETEIKETVTLNADEYTVDSSAYNKDEAGTYSIKVSYTLKDVTLEKSYDVTVSVVNFDGLEVTLADGTSDTVTLSAEATTALIDVTKIVVKEVNPSDGTVGNVTTDYSVALYKGEEKITLNDNKANVGGGVYQIWVSKASEVIADSTREAFVNIYVVDDLASIALNEGATLSQDAGDDVISATWNFTATYASGATKELTIADVTVEGLDTRSAGEKTATVSFTEANAVGVEKTQSCEVNYSITSASGIATQMFHVENVGSADGFSEVAYDGGASVVTGSLFKLISTVKAKTSIGGTYGNLQKDGNGVAYTDMEGNTHNPDQGIKLVSTIKTGETVYNIYTVEALKNITFHMYVVWANDSFNSNKSADVFYSVNDGKEKTQSLAKRNMVWAIKVELKAGDKLTLGATNTHKDSGNLWLFGAEAKTAGSESEVTDHNFSFDLNALANAAKGENALSDKMLVTADMFTGANAFLTFSGKSTTSANNIRTDSAATKVTGFEIKNGALSVTFQGTGTISITFCSNGSSNTSCIGLKNFAGDLLGGVPSDAVNVTMNGNMYEVAGSKISYTVTYTITEAGTYTIWAGSEKYNRVARVSGITMVDKY